MNHTGSLLMHGWSRRLATLILAAACVAAVPAMAEPREARVPLHEGKVRLADLTDKLWSVVPNASWAAKLSRVVRLPGEIDVSGVGGARCVEAMNAALGDGFRVTVDNDALVLHVDGDKLPKDWDATKAAVRAFTACCAPHATAAQSRQYGLLLPRVVDATKPMVILVHGLDCNDAMWAPLKPLLEQEGFQVALFNYPAAQHVADSAKLFGENVAALREGFPNVKLNVVTHSMGALVVRSYVEGPAYGGGVERLILVTPPNHGSKWAWAEPGLKLLEQAKLARRDPDWRWTWAITDGLGEAASDLRPKSKFLKQLNALPRREGVKYTIVAGSQDPANRIAGNLIGSAEKLIPERARDWWGVGRVDRKLAETSEKLRNKQANDDGPVSIDSAKLDGVDDFVVLPADHCTMYYGNDKSDPAAWDVIRDRLKR